MLRASGTADVDRDYVDYRQQAEGNVREDDNSSIQQDTEGNNVSVAQEEGGAGEEEMASRCVPRDERIAIGRICKRLLDTGRWACPRLSPHFASLSLMSLMTIQERIMCRRI